MKLVDFKREPWAEMVKELEHKLEQARAGELRGLVMAFEYASGEGGYLVMRDANCSPFKLLGGLVVAEAELTDLAKQSR
jgi:hypothetical protein